MTKEQLTAAIEAAGIELRNKYEWALDADHGKPVMETLFAQVLMKHFGPVLDPAAAETARQVRIAALRAELEVLESRNNEAATITQRERDMLREWQHDRHLVG